MPSITTAAMLDQRLQETGALLKGHFQLSSGLHSDRYIQVAKLLQYPEHASWACHALAQRIQREVDVVVGPALGGVLVAYELARALGVRALFTERTEGVMQLRRGFELSRGERVLIVEDVVTTGLSASEAAGCVRNLGGEVVAFASLIDRSGGRIDLGLPFVALLPIEAETYRPQDCPLCAAGTAVIKPGSRLEMAPTR